ncbi:MAG TPA: hypothetical protein DHV46_02410 [Desulfovibrio piger]|nr:hypothetical protein [Desulfovibrio piger]
MRKNSGAKTVSCALCRPLQSA